MSARSFGPGETSVARATETEWILALSLVLQHLPTSERARKIAQVVTDAREAPERLGGLFLGRVEGAPTAASWSQLLAGRTALLWGPRGSQRFPDELRKGLLEAAFHHAQQEDANLIQTILDADHSAGKASPPERDGFDLEIRMSYLIWKADPLPSSNAEGDTCTFVPYHPDSRSELERVIAQTYVDTRDAPLLNGRRCLSDVVEGYLATANFDYSKWWLVRTPTDVVGCLLLADHVSADTLELVYMGVVPAARGRAIGRTLVRQAQRSTLAAGRSQLVLAVDADNTPAIRVYSALDFHPLRDQLIRLKFLSDERF